MEHRIYLSPHLDDVVFSCGGLVRDQANRGETIEIWTICAGDPPVGELSAYAQQLHDRWRLGRDAVTPRRAEDVNACALVGAEHRHHDLPDCIYRRDPLSGGYLYTGDDGIFGALAEIEAGQLAPALARTWARQIPAGAEIVSPLGLGGHVDHQLVRLAAELMERPLKYYADTPYVFAWESEIPNLLPENALVEVLPVSEEGLKSWIAGNAAYESQISSFWESLEEMESLFRGYAERNGGIRLWRKGN